MPESTATFQPLCCPFCGCNDLEVIKAPDPNRNTWWGSGEARCNHCGQAVSIRHGSQPPPPARIIPQPECPDCGAAMKVAETRKLFRWYQCPECGTRKKVGRRDGDA